MFSFSFCLLFQYMMNENKNSSLKGTSATHCKEPEKNVRIGLVIRILQESWSDVQILPDIRYLSKLFEDSLILYESGKVHVFTQLSAVLAHKLKDFGRRSLLRLNFENIGSWSHLHECFLIYKLNDNDTLVLPHVSQTAYFFQQLKENLSPVFVKLVDILQEGNTSISYLPSKTEHIYRHNNSESSKHSTWKDTSCFKTRKISLKRIRKVVTSTLQLTTLSLAFPLSRETPMNENYPQQATQEQDDEGRSEFAFSNGLSLPVTTDLASGLAIGGNSLSRYSGLHSSTENAIPHAGNSRQYSENSSNRSTLQIPRHPDFMDFNDRLRSYARWTHRNPDPNTLSRAGFFYTNDGDLVKCFQCGIGLKDFSDDDNPLKEHVRHSGNCHYLIEMLGESTLAEWKRQLQAQDPEYNRQMQWNERHNISAVPYNYRHPEYQTLEARLATFTSWPAQIMQRPEQLTDAGLYYTGFEDHVRCFACDGGLRRWDPEDDPWTEHCRWFPACPFAKEKKGDEYIALVQAAVAFENEENESAQPRGQDLLGAMEQMTLRDPEFRAALNEHKDACLEMGYQLPDFNEAIQELRNRGTIKPTIEEIIDVIEVVKARKLQESTIQARQNETPVEENQRLKSYVICMSCHQNNVNALFLPCTHHRMCLECAERVTHCPVCERYIRQKIRTYLV